MTARAPALAAVLLAGLLAALAGHEPARADGATLRVTVRNELDLARPSETVELAAAALAGLAKVEELQRLHVAEEGTGRELPAQAVDEDGDGAPERLVFQADFAPRSERAFRFSLGEKRAWRREDFRVYGRFVRERFDDFAWENDRIAQRVYGQALETWAKEPLTSSAVDVWLKRTRRLVVNDWYLLDDYHRDNGEGADLYSAGASRGCGGSGLWRDGHLVVSRNFRESRVLAPGPLRLLFELGYPAWDAAFVRGETKRVTLDAGQNLDRFESRYALADGGPLTFAVGIKKQAGASLRVERSRGWLRTWEPVKDGGGNFGCGVVLDPAAIVDVSEDALNHLVLARAPQGAPAVYYAGFGWDRSGDFAGVGDWDRYLDERAQALRSPLRVEVGAQPPAPAATATPAAAAVDPWTRLPEILARIVPPRFPARECKVAGHGCRADGRADCSLALRTAIEACHEAGGGRVLVPPGELLTGALRLLSNVELHVPAGSTLRFSQDPAQYLPVVFTRWEGVELMNYSPLIYAFEAENVAVTGAGTLDGQADEEHWWPWKGGTRGQPGQKPDRDRLFAQAEQGLPVAERVYGAGHYLRPPFIEPYRSRNVLIEGLTIRNSPFWVIHPVLSSNVIVRGVQVLSAGPNSDGCDPESSTDVLIEDTLFDTGDDCIAIKSGRNADGRRLAAPTRNVVIRGCRMRAGHGGVTIGSEVSGGVSGVWAERCRMSSPELERGLRIKTNAMRGGVVEDVFLRDIEIGEVRRAAIEVDMLYEEGDAGAFVPVVRNLRVERMSVERAAQAFWVAALERSPLRGLLVRDSRFAGVRQGSRLDGVRDFVLDNVTITPAGKETP